MTGNVVASARLSPVEGEASIKIFAHKKAKSKVGAQDLRTVGNLRRPMN